MKHRNNITDLRRDVQTILQSRNDKSKKYAFTEVRKGFEQQSGAVKLRTDDVFHNGKNIGKLQHRIVGNTEETTSISAVGGVKPGKNVTWLINRAKGALLFVSEKERTEAFEFNNQRKGAPKGAK